MNVIVPPPAVEDVCATVAAARLTARTPLTVAIDGVDGVGKTTFADLLAARLATGGIGVHRASIDDFHFPREHRYRRGRRDPVGYFEDSFDHAAFARLVLDPLEPGGSRSVPLRYHDLTTDEFVDDAFVDVRNDDVFVVDGVFLQSTKLRGRWGLAVFLDAPFDVTVARAIDRDEDEGRHERQVAAELARDRYVPGQQLYLDTCDPLGSADIVIDATDARAARVVRPLPLLRQ